MTRTFKASLHMATTPFLSFALLFVLGFILLSPTQASATVEVTSCNISVQISSDASIESILAQSRPMCQSSTDPRSLDEVVSEYRQNGYGDARNIFAGLTQEQRLLLAAFNINNADSSVVSLFLIEGRDPFTVSVITISSVVHLGNQPPNVIGHSNRTTRLDKTLTVEIGATDADGDDLQYQATSSNENVATATPTELVRYNPGSQVTVSPVAVGTTTITVTVSDGTSTSTGEFQVTVESTSQTSDEFTYRLCAYDNGTVQDGDNVNIFVNDEIVFDNLELEFEEQCTTVTLKRDPERNAIRVQAISEGSSPTNTAALRLRHATSGASVSPLGTWGLSAGEQQEWVVYAISENQVTLTAATADSAQQQAVEGTVAAVAAATVSNVTSNIGARFSAPNTGGASISLAGMPVVFGQSGSHDSTWTSLANDLGSFGGDLWQSPTRSLAGDELLGSSSFEIALGASEANNSPDAGRQVTVWGRGDFQVFESGGGQNSGYDGDLVAGYLGADFNTGGSWLVGMALSRIKAEADYTLENAEGAGTLEAELTNLHPYARFAVDDRSEVWTILGLGKGEVTDTAQGESPEKSDLSMHMMSAGARHLLNSFIGIDWALLGDGSLAKVETDQGEGVQAVDGISASVWRVRAGVEASYTTVWEGGSTLTSFLEVAGRQDGGASAEGQGLELSPGLAFSDSESGFSIEARGRALVLHSAENHREYGASLTVSKAPDAYGTGLSLAMTPTWGAPTNSLDSIDASLFPQNAGDARSDSLSLNSRVSYGFVAGPGVVAPFAEFSLHDSDSHRTRVGSRYSLGPSVALELSADRTSDVTEDAEHSVQFRARIGF